MFSSVGFSGIIDYIYEWGPINFISTSVAVFFSPFWCGKTFYILLKAFLPFLFPNLFQGKEVWLRVIREDLVEDSQMSPPRTVADTFPTMFALELGVNDILTFSLLFVG